MAFNYFDNASFIGLKQSVGINNLNSETHNRFIPAAGWRRGGRNGNSGTYTFTVPAGVTEVSAVCIGGGGGGGGNNGVSGPGATGGGGGGLSYGTFTVTPGENLTVRVGAGGAAGTGSANAFNGNISDIRRSTTTLLSAFGGTGGISNTTSTTNRNGGSGSGIERDGGGTGGAGGGAQNNGAGAGGGGAGGYAGNGGNGQNAGAGQAAQAGSGGGGAGGLAVNSAPPGANSGGGGTGVDGQGNSGTVSNSTTVTGSPDSYSTLAPTSVTAGIPGGGGGGTEDDTAANGTNGGLGCVRIIWGQTTSGETRFYPNTNTSQSVQAQNDETTDSGGGGGGDDGGGGGGKIVCTALNKIYGFGSFRNKVWMKYNNYKKAQYPSNSKILELGYHKVFGRLTEIMPTSPILTKVLRRMVRVRTDRIRREMAGKPITFESRLYPAIIRPIFYAVGWLVHKGILSKYDKNI